MYSDDVFDSDSQTCHAVVDSRYEPLQNDFYMLVNNALQLGDNELVARVWHAELRRDDVERFLSGPMEESIVEFFTSYVLSRIMKLGSRLAIIPTAITDHLSYMAMDLNKVKQYLNEERFDLNDYDLVALTGNFKDQWLLFTIDMQKKVIQVFNPDPKEDQSDVAVHAGKFFLHSILKVPDVGWIYNAESPVGFPKQLKKVDSGVLTLKAMNEVLAGFHFKHPVKFDFQPKYANFYKRWFAYLLVAAHPVCKSGTLNCEGISSLSSNVPVVSVQKPLDVVGSALPQRRTSRMANMEQLDMDTILKKAFDGAPGEVLKSIDTNGLADTHIKRENIETLLPNKWLDDNVIDFYISMIKNQLPAQSVFFTKVFHMKTLQKDNPELHLTEITGWLVDNEINVGMYKLVVLPVHLGAHWVFATADLVNKQVTVYDSLHQGHPETIDQVYSFLEKASEASPFTKSTSAPFQFVKSEWRAFGTPLDYPLQRNSYDCGVFTLIGMKTVARSIAENSPLSFDYGQDDMNRYRRRIAYEILTFSPRRRSA